ncbi:hypothetical protein ACFOYU_20020 [Microvirga sp. GCM10011540]|uniref:hypothetical protein n=1 Tax=Microvirga sp. GCM10011540 TaxID=3317338 RepID=UPI0036137B60
MLRSLAIPFVALAVAAIDPASAQDNSNRSGNRSDQRASGDGQAEVGQPNAQTAYVGAGTTNGSTTGYSGPTKVTNSTPGQIEVPPLPSPKLCEPYRDTPAAYQSCLWVSLKD